MENIECTCHYTEIVEVECFKCETKWEKKLSHRERFATCNLHGYDDIYYVLCEKCTNDNIQTKNKLKQRPYQNFSTNTNDEYLSSSYFNQNFDMNTNYGYPASMPKYYNQNFDMNTNYGNPSYHDQNFDMNTNYEYPRYHYQNMDNERPLSITNQNRPIYTNIDLDKFWCMM
jgi:hypothetical protein